MDGEKLARHVLSELLDKYENSEAFRKGEPTQARIQLKFTDSVVPGYASGRLDPDDRAALHSALLRLAGQGLIELKWVRFEQGNILERVYLQWERINTGYEYLCRTSQREKLAEFTAGLEQWLGKLSGEGMPHADQPQQSLSGDMLKSRLPEAWRCIEPWIHDVLAFVRERGRIPSSLIPEDEETRGLLLRALDGLVQMAGRSMPVRIFSKQVLGNSKVFEKQVQSHVMRLVRRYWYVGHPLEVDAPEDDATLLREIGIESGHEDITFCGPIRFRYIGSDSLHQGTPTTRGIDAGIFPHGLAIDASDVHRIQITEAPISRILTIENKANYRAYVRQNRQPDELVVYLGGFASPAQRTFISLLRSFVDGTVMFHHWGDLDYGGILILQNLRNSCWPEAVPWRMGPELLDQYIDYVEPIDDDTYRFKLERLLESNVYEWAHPLIKRILKVSGTLEQEALLGSE